MPQCPEDTFWVAKIESLKKFIDNIINEFSIDTSRIYLCGLSMGGFGTWYTAMAYPEMFAAIFPVCPAWVPGEKAAAQLKNTPMWLTSGVPDPLANYFAFDSHH
jgi:predicted peptidase